MVNFLKKNNSNIIFTSMTHTNITALIIKIFFLQKLKVIIREFKHYFRKGKRDLRNKKYFIKLFGKKFYIKSRSYSGTN